MTTDYRSVPPYIPEQCVCVCGGDSASSAEPRSPAPPDSGPRREDSECGSPTQGQHPAHKACSGPLHSPRVPRSSALLSAASRVSSCLEAAHGRGCRDPGGNAPGGGVASRPAFGDSWSQVGLPDMGSDSDHQLRREWPPGWHSTAALGSAEGRGAFSNPVLRCSCLQCPVKSHKVLRLPALCSGGKTDWQKAPPSN